MISKQIWCRQVVRGLIFILMLVVACTKSEVVDTEPEVSLLGPDQQTYGACTPKCANKPVGSSNGCGGRCGNCTNNCTCTPNCTGKTCGSDGCSGSCGTCDDGVFCNGVETCGGTGTCVAGTNPCSGNVCQESTKSCIPATDQVPVMMTATTPSGIATWSSSLSLSEAGYRAFNKSSQVYDNWQTNWTGSAQWLAYEWTDSPRKITSYQVESYVTSNPTRAPKNWTLQGWNGSAWVTIDTVTNQITWGALEKRSFEVDTPGFYSKVRWRITAINGGTYLLVGDLYLLGISQNDVCNCPWGCKPASTTTCLSNLVPSMTSETLPSGQVSKSSEYGSSNQAWRAFDKVSNSSWMAQTPPQWIAYAWNDANTRPVYRYRIQFPAAAGNETRAPKNWTLEGWDGTSWTVVDSVIGQTGWSVLETREFSCDVVSHYSKYRLNVTATNGDSYMNIDQLHLLGQTCEGSSDSCASAFDGINTGIRFARNDFSRSSLETLFAY